MRADYKNKGELEHILAALMPENRLACELSLATGLRIDDCLSIKTKDLSQRMTVKEKKTGKARRIYIPQALLERLQINAGALYVFEARSNAKRHRTRQAVYKDLRRAAVLFRVSEHISPHTARKVWAVEQYKKAGGDLKHVQHLLQHSNEAVTMLYAMADIITARKYRKEP